ncbi:MAG: sulfatase [Halobacteriales archaeon]
MADTERPNVLFFFADQHHPDWVEMHPDIPVRTPNIQRLADGGVWFENAVCPSPVCGPSRACLASGMEYDRCGMANHDVKPSFDRDNTHYARLRDEAGYHVMGCGKTLDKFYGLRGPEGKHRIEEFGLSDGVRNRGKWASAYDLDNPREHVYQRYLDDQGLLEAHKRDFRLRKYTRADHFAATHPTPLPDDAYCDNWVAQNGLDLIADAPDDRPWHMEVSFIGPHDPLDVTHEMYGWYRDPPVDFPGPAPIGAEDGFDGRTHNEIRRNYAAMIENIDRWVGRYLDRLEERGELENTLIIYSADHGDMLGDHGRWKKQSPYHGSAGVPLVVSGPGVATRGRVEEPASVLDVHATCLDYAGLDHSDVDSRSLRPYLEGDTDSHREVAHSGLGPWRLVTDGRYKLLTGYDPDATPQGILPDDSRQVRGWNALPADDQRAALEEREVILFDRDTDPNETTNVANEHPEVVAALDEHIPEVEL